MLDNLRKSLSAALYERTASPLYGTFLVSWCLWNWQILYLLFWEDEAIDFKSTMDLASCYTEWWRLTIVPIASTIILLTLGNWLGNQAFYLQLHFDKNRRKRKENSDDDKRLSIEESISIRKSIYDQRENTRLEIKSKDTEIELLNKQLQIVLAKQAEINLPTIEDVVQSTISGQQENDLFDKVLSQLRSIKDYEEFIERIMERTRLRIEIQSNDPSLYNYVPSKLLNILEANDIYYIDEQKKGYYSDKGKKFIEYYADHKYGNKQYSEDISHIFKKVIFFEKYEQQLSSLMDYIQDGEKVNSSPSERSWIDPDLIALLEANEIIENVRGVGVYALTTKGKTFMKFYYEEKNFK